MYWNCIIQEVNILNIEGFEFKLISKHIYSNGEVIFILSLDNFKYCWRWKNTKEPTLDIFNCPDNYFDYCPICIDTYGNSKRCHDSSYLGGKGKLMSRITMEQIFVEETSPLLPYDKIFFS